MGRSLNKEVVTLDETFIRALCFPHAQPGNPYINKQEC